jgi:archaellin
VLDDDADVLKIHVELADGEDALDNLDEGEQATLTITTEAGGETEVRVTVPDSLAGESAVTL